MTNEIQPQIKEIVNFDGLRDISAVSPEVAIRRPMSELVEATLAAAASHSAHTQRSYLTGIGLFLAYLDDRLGDKLPDDWRPLAEPTKDPDHPRRTLWEYRGEAGILRAVYAGILDDYAAHRLAAGDSTGTQAIRLAAVKSFLAVALRDGIITQEQAVNMGLKPYKGRQKRDNKTTGRRLQPEEVKRLRAIVELTAKHDTKAIRDRALIDCMLYAGLRRSEVAGLKTSSFVQDLGRWWIELTGKGKKTRKVKIHDTLYQSIKTWLDLRGLEIGQGDEWVFCNMGKGGQLSGDLVTEVIAGEKMRVGINANVIGRIVSEYGQKAGLGKLAAHDLRRTCARNAFDNGAKLAKIQAMLGHSDIKTTMVYIGYEDGNGEDTAIDYVHY